MNSENVKIPLALLNDTVSILELLYHCRNSLNLAPDFEEFLLSILCRLQYKQRSLELRVAYSAMISSKTKTERCNARMNYLKLKMDIKNQR